jgi:hypothetical protein
VRHAFYANYANATARIVANATARIVANVAALKCATDIAHL